MKQRLVMLATLLSAAGAGTFLFVDWDTGAIVQPRQGGFELLACSAPTVCNAQGCIQAQNLLDDGGFPGCDPRLFECEVRLGQAARNWALDAGVTLSSKPYQTLRFVGLRCPAIDGGFARGIPMDDLGLPQFKSLTAGVPGCARAPVGNTTCERALQGGGQRFFGEGNVFPAGEARGTGCEPVNCKVMFGDSDGEL